MSWLNAKACKTGYVWLNAKKRMEVYADLIWPYFTIISAATVLLAMVLAMLELPQNLYALFVCIMYLANFFTVYLCFMWVRCYVDFISSNRVLVVLLNCINEAKEEAKEKAKNERGSA